MFSIMRKTVVQPQSVPILSDQAAALVARMRAMSVSDPTLANLLKELAPHLPAPSGFVEGMRSQRAAALTVLSEDGAPS